MNNEQTKAQKVEEEISEFVNNFGCDEKGFAEAVMKDHRTLQQNIFRVFIETIREWAKCYDEGRYDDRNKKTCEISKKIIDMMNKDHDNDIPMI